jgi:prepilin signal peptidase PulO-like enzyme (type II secretory pathway)
MLSWVFTLGRCRSCTARIPYRYALTEATLAVLFYASAVLLGPVPALPLLLGSLFILTVAVLYDLRHTIVPMPLSLLLILSSLAYRVVYAPDTHALALVLLTAGAIGSGFFLMHVLSGGRWMGLGDAPIALALSLLAGPAAVSGLLFSFWIGAVIGIGILVASPRGHRMGIEVPFVPFLAAGYLLALFTQWNPFTLL